MSTVVAAIPADAVSSGSAPNSAPGSPKNRVKFLCSHGGKILPRPADGHIKYVGGETRVISVPRDIPFPELMKKLTYLINGEMVLKYQVVSEDLDALVSVRCDEDQRHMFDEIDRYENAGAPRLRAFLFPANPIVMVENHAGAVDHHALEQRYIDAVNGIVRSKQHPTINGLQQQHGSLVSSACTSPRSPDSCTTETMNNNINEAVMLYNISRSMMNNNSMLMHKVQSSPNIYGLNVPQQQHYIHQQSPQYVVHQHYPAAGYQSPKPPIDSQKGMGPDRLISVRSVGRTEGMRYQMDSMPPHNHYSSSSSSSLSHYNNNSSNRGGGNGCCSRCMHYDDCGYFRVADRTGVGHGHGGMKAWDSAMSGGDI